MILIQNPSEEIIVSILGYKIELLLKTIVSTSNDNTTPCF